MPATTSRSPAIAAALSAERLANAETTALCSSVSATLLDPALLLVETSPPINAAQSMHANLYLFLFTTYLR
jgi:hypothetical protein